MRCTDRELQDNNLVGSLDQFAKTADSRDSVDLILTHVYPYMYLTIMLGLRSFVKEIFHLEKGGEGDQG